MELGLANKTVLVTAGSQGIGLACAQAYAREGAQVIICGRSADSLQEAAKSMTNCNAIQADLTKATDIDDLMAEIKSRYQGIDVLVNNAGGPPPGDFDSLDDEQWHAAINLVLMSVIRCTRHVLPHMKQQKSGRIVNISSSGIKQPVPGLTLSNSIRMAVLGWAKTLSHQVAADGILVNTVCPGWTKTNRVTSLITERTRALNSTEQEQEAAIVSGIPLGRMGKPEEIANLAVFLGSQAASFMTGTAIAVDGGSVEGYS